MKPLTNTRLLSPSDAIAIQEAMIDLRTAAGETLLGWSMIDSSAIAPILSGSVVDGRVVKGIPSQAIDVRVEPVLVQHGDAMHLGLRAIDKVMGIDLLEDEVAHGHGLVTLVVGPPLPEDCGQGFTVRWGREQRTLPGGVAGLRESVEALVAQRGRAAGETITTAALMPSMAIERGGEIFVMVTTPSASVDASLRQL